MSTVIPLRDKMIPWYFVMFFIVIALVDGSMVAIAIRTHSGTVTEHPYEKGLAYNRVVEAQKKQDELGWQGEIDYRQGMLYFFLRDRDGKAITPDNITAAITRPTQSGMDFSVKLKSTASALKFPMDGLWEIQVDAMYQGEHYQQSKRIVVE